MAIFFFMISKKIATKYFMTWITGKRTTQKCKKCDWSVKRDFGNKKSVHNTEKWENRYLLSEKRIFNLKIIINHMQIETQIF